MRVVSVNRKQNDFANFLLKVSDVLFFKIFFTFFSLEVWKNVLYKNALQSFRRNDWLKSTKKMKSFISA